MCLTQPDRSATTPRDIPHHICLHQSPCPMPACSGCRQGGSGWGGSCSPQHNKHPGFNETGEAAPVFPWHAVSDWHRHTFITSFVHCNVNVPSSSPPSALRRFTKSESERRRELCPFLLPSPFLPPLPTLGGIQVAGVGWVGSQYLCLGFAPLRGTRPPSTQPLLSSCFRSFRWAQRNCNQSTWEMLQRDLLLQ